jgi:hypothetical protein
MTLEEDKRICWEAGELSWKLLPHQLELHEAFHQSEGRKFVVRCARRFGKSYWCCVEAVMACLRKPGAQVRYAAPTAKMVRTIIEPHMRHILADAPPSVRPDYRRQDGLWQFPNGSQLWIAGCDNQGYEKLRGTDTDLGIVDEAGFVDELAKVIDDVLLPQTITRDGHLLIPSTPPRTPAHDFLRYDVEAQRMGAHIHRSIYDATHVTAEQIEEYKRESGGEDTTTWQREYEAKVVVEETDAVVPEFAKNEETLVEEVERPPHFDPYVAIDFGYSDLTFAGFGYYHFDRNTVVIEDELVWQHSNSARIVADCKDKERALWPHHDGAYRRVADAPQQLLADVNQVHGYLVAPTAKDDKEAQINLLRLACAEQGTYRLRIHPRCTALRAHLRHAVWNTRRTDFDRSGDHGHFDGVDMLLYLCRNVQTRRNPYPPLWRGETDDTHFIPEGAQQSGTAKTFRDLFGKSRR